MASSRWLCCLFVLVVGVVAVEAWSGHVCTRRTTCYRYRRVCRYRWWRWCCSYTTIREAYYCTEQYCCRGWTHNGNQNCNIPVCSPPCQNGGTCTSPGKCSCTVQYNSYRCATAVCSHLAPCFPGTCQTGDNCDCSSGFTTINSNKREYCLKIEDTPQVDLRMNQMQVRMSYWPRYAKPPMELHWIMADSTDLPAGQKDFMWTNRRDFNRLETTCSSQYFPPDLTGKPPFIGDTGFGIVDGKIEVNLLKLPVGGGNGTFVSLNKTIPCQQTVSSTSPETDIYNCSIVDLNFDRFLEHRDSLEITFQSTGGGFRKLLNRNDDPPSPYLTQNFYGVTRTLAVEFRFDFLLPHHCEETSSCTSGESMLDVPDITKNNPIRIAWQGWVDDDSKMFRYAWEVFKMNKTIDGGLEIKPSLALSPLVNREVMASSYTPQTYNLPGPGMYSVILEAGDLANNTKFVRRLVLFDPAPEITSDPNHNLYVSTASAAANYTYQNNASSDIVVTWDRHFRNAIHEDNALLGHVRRYPAELRDGNATDGRAFFRKVIPINTPQEDHEGERTVDAIANERGIVNFKLQHAKDHDGGQNQPVEPTGSWIDMYLNTSFTVPETPSEADTVTIWVKAKDIMGTEVVGRTQVTFDGSPPSVQHLTFHMNVPVEGIDFSSTFSLDANDMESGIAFVDWTFRRVSNGTVIHQQRVHSTRMASCDDFKVCVCTPAGDCFAFNQTYSLSNCLMMVEKENLATETINVTADVTNMAGLVTRVHMLKDDLTELNGTEAYYPPQNVTMKSLGSDSVTITWSFPPSCFARTAVWVIVNDRKLAVHKDAEEFTVTGLEPETAYTIYLVTEYTGDEQSDRAPLVFTTAEGPSLSVGAIVGIVIAFLLLALLVLIIVVFVLWRRGLVFQKEGTPVNKQLHRMSRALTTVRHTVRRGHGDGAFANNAYRPDSSGQDEIYLYGEMTFNTRQGWQLDDSSLTLMDHVADGKFATIYKATWRHDQKQDTVAAKMLKPGFTQDDALKMMAKINFFATQLEDHENVIKFIGAVTDNQGWGPVLVMEYCEMGQMDKWLVQNKTNMTEQVMENLFRLCLGIAKGMEYLASKKVTHKRLAARNVLLNFLLEPRVAGFGPQHKEGDEDKATRIPAKWAAPEVLQDKPPTEKSDVWSYGVVLWEIFSMGQVPYPGIHAQEIGTRLKSGYRMDKPEFADDTYYELMKECWQYKQSKRPTFGTIRARLAQQYSGNGQSVGFYYDTNQLNG